MSAWDKCGSFIKGARVTYDMEYYDAFEWLAEKFRKMQEEERKGEPIKHFIELRDKQKKFIQNYREESRKDQQESEPS
jgi:hypothetical protein